MITVYVMAAGELEQPKLYEVAMGKVDRVRYNKICRMKSSADRARSLSAGLLLQYCVQREKMDSFPATDGVQGDIAGTQESGGIEARESVMIRSIQFVELLAETGSPIQLSYVYGAEGKPYLSDYPNLFFSLSHSGNYAICAVSDREVGADIQMKKAQSGIRLAKRYFHEKERQMLNNCVSEKEKSELFYRLWAAKEAYIKLTGQGIKQGFHNFYADFEHTCMIEEAGEGQADTIGLWEQEWCEAYRIAVCFYSPFTKKW